MTVEADDSRFGQIRLEDMQRDKPTTRKILALIKRALDHSDGRHTLDTVIDGLQSGKFTLWGTMRLQTDDELIESAESDEDPGAPLFFHAVAVSTIETYENGMRVFKIQLLAGPSMSDAAIFFRYLPELEKAARAKRCVKLVIVGRKGWERDLSEGWRAVATVYERGLS